METGTKKSSLCGTASAASTTMLSRPSLGGRSLPVRERPPSRKNSIGVAFADEAAHVSIDDRAVQPIAAERAPNEECAPATQHAAERKEGKVVAGGDERELQVGVVEDEREHQVVEMALVTR